MLGAAARRPKLPTPIIQRSKPKGAKR
jgi:hypothetical protein